MSLMDDINALPTSVQKNTTNHLNHHATIHAALKDHVTRLRNAEQSAVSADVKATSAENKVDAYTPRVDALEAMNGVSPESPVDGQTANLITQEDTLTRQALDDGWLGNEYKTSLPVLGDIVGMHPSLPDNTDALKAVMQQAKDRQRPAVIPQGTYFIHGKTNTVKLAEGATWSLQGEPGAVLKVPDGIVDGNYHRLLVIDTDNAGDVERVDIRGLTIDMNSRGQTDPPRPYSREHSAAITITGRASGKIKNVTISDYEIIDPLADGIWSNTWYIDELIISNMRGTDRRQVRSDIQLSALPRYTRITNFVGDGLESEPVSGLPESVTHDFEVHISDSTIRQTLDFGSGQYGHRMLLTLHNVEVGERLILGGLRGRISDSKFHFKHTGGSFDRRFTALREALFDNCDFYLYADEDGHVPYLQLAWLGRGFRNRINFNNCRFHVVPTPGYDGSFTGWAVNINPVISGEPDYKVVFDNCWFDSRFEYSLYVDRVPHLEVRGGSLSGTTAAIRWVSTYSKLIIDNVGLRDTPEILRFDPTSSGELEMRGEYKSENSDISFGGGEGNLPNITIHSTRRIAVDSAPPAKALRGDRAYLKQPVVGQTYEWICTRSSFKTATWEPLLSLPAELDPEPTP